MMTESVAEAISTLDLVVVMDIALSCAEGTQTPAVSTRREPYPDSKTQDGTGAVRR